MKRLLLATLEYPPTRGGVAEYLYGVKNALPRDMVDVLAVSVPTGHWPRRWLLLLPKIWKKMDEIGADALAISHVLPMGYIALLTRWWKRTPFIVFVHGTDLKAAAAGPRKKRWASRILRSAALVVANSEYTRRLALDFGVPQEKMEIVYPCPSIRPDATTQALAADIKRRHHLEGKRVILSVARLVPRKGIDRVLRVLPHLRRELKNVAYAVVGDGHDADRLHRLAQELQITDVVVFAGAAPRAELTGWYAAADVFALPGSELPQDVEGFGMAFLEAAAHGLPSVSGRAGGAPEAVLNGETGWLVNPESEEDLFRALARVLTNPEEAHRMGESARRRVAEEFIWEKQAAKLVAHLEKL